MTDNPNNLPRVPLAERVTEWREASVCRDACGSICIWGDDPDLLELRAGRWKSRQIPREGWRSHENRFVWSPRDFAGIYPACPPQARARGCFWKSRRENRNENRSSD